MMERMLADLQEIKANLEMHLEMSDAKEEARLEKMEASLEGLRSSKSNDGLPSSDIDMFGKFEGRPARN
jgi:hypothetical protein